MVEVDGVGVEDLDVESPFFEVGGGDEGYAGGEVGGDLGVEGCGLGVLTFGLPGVFQTATVETYFCKFLDCDYRLTMVRGNGVLHGRWKFGDIPFRDAWRRTL